MKIDVETIRKKIGSITESLGFELDDISAPVVGGRLVLRIFIFSSNGVNLDDCAKISRAIANQLEEDDSIASRYTLEVSSLGLDKPLLTTRDFQRRIGEKVKITYDNNGKRHSAKGILIECDNDMIKIKQKEEMILIPVNASPKGKIII